MDAGLVGDGLGGLAIQAGEFTLQDEGSVVALLGAFEQGEVTRQERMQAARAGVDLFGGDGGCLEQRLCFRMFQKACHDRLSRLGPTARVAGRTVMARVYPLQ